MVLALADGTVAPTLQVRYLQVWLMIPSGVLKSSIKVTVEGTICDCGEILIPGGFPKWPLLFLAAIPLFFIDTGDDIDHAYSDSQRRRRAPRHSRPSLAFQLPRPRPDSDTRAGITSAVWYRPGCFRSWPSPAVC